MIFDEDNFPKLPDSWISLNVSEVCENLSLKNKILSKNYLQEGKLPVVDQGAALIGGYTDDEANAVTDQLPVVVFGDHTRAIKYVNFKFAAGADGIKVLSPKNMLIPRLFYRFLEAVRLPDKGYARHYQHLRASSIAIPPLKEQKRIVEKLDELLKRVNDCRERLDRVPLILKRFRHAVLAAATSGALTEDWRQENDQSGSAHILLNAISSETKKTTLKLRTSRFSPVQDEVKLPTLPNNWKWTKLDRIVQEGRPIIYGIIKPGPHDPNGIPYVRVVEMKDGEIAPLEQLKRASLERASRFSRASLNSGDILISKDGTIGRVAIVPPELAGGNITQHLVRASIHHSLNNVYVANAIRADHSQRWLLREAKGIGLQGVNVEDFRRLPIPIPPRAEQDEIVRRVEKLFAFADRLETSYTAARKHVEQLTPALLAKAFSGELVEQDPSDEPALVLLERIRAEQEVQVKQKQTRGRMPKA